MFYEYEDLVIYALSEGMIWQPCRLGHSENLLEIPASNALIHHGKDMVEDRHPRPEETRCYT